MYPRYRREKPRPQQCYWCNAQTPVSNQRLALLISFSHENKGKNQALSQPGVRPRSMPFYILIPVIKIKRSIAFYTEALIHGNNACIGRLKCIACSASHRWLLVTQCVIAVVQCTRNGQSCSECVCTPRPQTAGN